MLILQVWRQHLKTTILPVRNDETLTLFAFGATELYLRANLKVNTESVFPGGERVNEQQEGVYLVPPAPNFKLHRRSVSEVGLLDASYIIRNTDDSIYIAPFIACCLSLMSSLWANAVLLCFPLNVQPDWPNTRDKRDRGSKFCSWPSQGLFKWPRAKAFSI